MENELAQRVPRRGPVVRLTEAGAPLPRRCRSSSPSTSSTPGAACRRAGRRPSVSRPLDAGRLRLEDSCNTKVHPPVL